MSLTNQIPTVEAAIAQVTESNHFLWNALKGDTSNKDKVLLWMNEAQG
jgi:hypothetical protein